MNARLLGSALAIVASVTVLLGAASAAPADAAAGGRYAIGDRFDPPGLVDSHARPFRFASLAPHAVALGFVTTACRTGQCSLVTGKFARLLATADARRERLVLVAIDARTDTPAALARYARLFAGDDRLVFVTGDARTLAGLTRRFGVRADSGALATHGETVALLDGDGRIADLLAGFDWSPSTLQGALDAVARIAYNPFLRALVHLTWSAQRLCGEHPVDSPLALHHAGLLAFAAVPFPVLGFVVARVGRRRRTDRES